MADLLKEQFQGLGKSADVSCLQGSQYDDLFPSPEQNVTAHTFFLIFLSVFVAFF